MQKPLRLVIMVGSLIATSFCPSVRARAQATATPVITTSTDDTGHTIYVNDEVRTQPLAKRPATATGGKSSLVYWSVTNRCWKPVPAASVRAAHSAMDEVNRILARNSRTARPSYGYSTSSLQNTGLSNTAFSSRGRRAFTQQEVDVAIDQAARQHNLDPNLVRAVIKVESNFNPNAVSPKGAMGLMQLMPQTARELNVSNPFDPQQNVDAGVRHLKRLMESYGGDVSLTLAAYNAGAGAVARSAGVPNFRETRSYVSRISSLYYGTPGTVSRKLQSPAYSPMLVQRDSRGSLYISNTD